LWFMLQGRPPYEIDSKFLEIFVKQKDILPIGLLPKLSFLSPTLRCL